LTETGVRLGLGLVVSVGLALGVSVGVAVGLGEVVAVRLGLGLVVSVGLATTVGVALGVGEAVGEGVTVSPAKLNCTQFRFATSSVPDDATQVTASVFVPESVNLVAAELVVHVCQPPDFVTGITVTMRPVALFSLSTIEPGEAVAPAAVRTDTLLTPLPNATFLRTIQSRLPARPTFAPPPSSLQASIRTPREDEYDSA
jgi:hypothetical protein